MIKDGLLDMPNYDVNHTLYTKSKNNIGKFRDESKGKSHPKVLPTPGWERRKSSKGAKNKLEANKDELLIVSMHY